MKVKVKFTQDYEREITFPSFFKANGCEIYYCALDEKTAVAIYSDCITKSTPSAIAGYDDEEITPEQFTKKFDERIEQLQSLKSHFFTNKQ